MKKRGLHGARIFRDDTCHADEPTMLSRLLIRNFGLIDHLEWECLPGLNVLTGETGAGKSIIIDGLRFALGGRTRGSPLRDPTKPCLVEAVFELPTPPPAVADILGNEGRTLILRRQYLPDGRSRVRINGLAQPLSRLRAVGDHLIDFHGPHDHQLLLCEDGHIGLLDRLLDLHDLKKAYAARFETYSRLSDDLRNLKEAARSRLRDIEILTHQVRELEQVPLDDASWTAVEEDVRRLRNAERLYAGAASTLGWIEGTGTTDAHVVPASGAYPRPDAILPETGADEMIRRAFSPLKGLAGLDPDAAEFLERLEGIQESCERLAADLREYLEGLAFSPQEAAGIERLHDLYEDLRRKYGPSPAEVRDFLARSRERLRFLKDFEHNASDLTSRLAAAEQEVLSMAKRIRDIRRRGARRIEKAVERELRDLGIGHAAFEVRLSPCPPNASGADTVRFFISPNAGEPLKPLAEIVSSGEAARVMLALKRVLVEADPTPVLIFDEIDAQIGGRLGTVTGGKLKEIADRRQVLLVTHLPQIAAFGDAHFKVFKEVRDGRTLTNVRRLNEEERLEELAQMMTGGNPSPVARKHAAAIRAAVRGTAAPLHTPGVCRRTIDKESVFRISNL